MVTSYDHLKQLRSCDLLLELIEHPQDLQIAMHRYAASIIYSLAYGKRMKDNDEELNAIMGLVESFTEDCARGAHLVDIFPVLDCLPDVLAPWRNEARRKYKKEAEVSRSIFKLSSSSPAFLVIWSASIRSKRTV